MKFKNIKYFVLVAAIALSGACSSDYLDTYPTDEVSPETLLKDTKGIKIAVNGLAKLMVTQHVGSQGFNGEGTIKMYYGEYMGQNFRVNLPGWKNLIVGNFYDNVSSVYDYYPWHYYYKIIADANTIIEHVDSAEGTKDERQYLKAQALAYRAYSYTMLSQIYGYRWDDSNNGSQACLVLRTSENQPAELPLSPLADIYTQIYADLESAISLFDESNYDRRGENHLIDGTVAKAIFARAALAKKDYDTAKKYASLVKEEYPLMTVKQYQEGFANPNQEWIWSSHGASDEQLFYFSYQAYMAYNSSATAVRSYPKRMAKELYETIPETDIRRELFLDPTPFNTYNDKGVLVDGVYALDSGVTENGSEMDKLARDKFRDLNPAATVAAYMQFKIKANDMPGVGHLNHFRVSEMYLIEAEAEHFLGNDSEAAKILVELTKNSGRDEAYTCDKSGDEMFKEIVKYRGIELWGEGFDWFDMKRWNLDINRLEGKEGGNYPASLAGKIDAQSSHKWTWRTPNKEVDFSSELK
ncbi:MULTISPECIES: RagB/SusD family nutrient uptake outer membrane protein [Myroides]|uniref:RagB/SusD family nutrient uptake outer membrane protein n=1 Tax=Myroides albus TaxID=2562892 RepID=A0A6I3LRQ3_9FLAO|nr:MULTISPECIES: RagB/SusD family nutrient uptake outer membrane protein [Myroides]MTG98782.1 RagB/SusD family nutrient uptake outer membrane protein [Myroides albus]MVX35485.1 RagB/SusD family nutrient uptake outer membrane protein [Myroides sp. LoEW2-1]UVD80682.1 RagB/SusD family nutrient uptake outer membrane protein [Myroides albus]